MTNDLMRWLMRFWKGFWRMCLSILVLSALLTFIISSPVTAIAIWAVGVIIFVCIIVGYMVEERQNDR